MKKIITIIIIAILSLGGFFIFYRKNPGVMQKPIPSAQPYKSSTPKATPKPSIKASPSPSQIPSEINLDVPFTSQAPYQDWSLPYNEFCEETSALMAASYIKGEPIIDPDDANRKLLEVKAFEEKYFGYYEDTNAEQTAQILTEYYKVKNVVVKYEPSLEYIKNALANKKLVILPAAGQQLGNPYYRQPGPVYHMLVIKGYTQDGHFITNDPGTRRGENYIYPESVIMNAMHDWNFGKVESGRKVVIIVG